MSADLTKSLDLYAKLTRQIPTFDERSEVENVLIWREAIYEALLAGQKLSETQNEVLAEADDRLVEQAAWITEHFPQVFEHGRRVPRDRWWWHLNEGPQVREEAERAA